MAKCIAYIRFSVPVMMSLGLIIMLGCTSWRETPSEGFNLPPVRLAPDGVALQVTFLRVPTGQTDFNTELWGQVDEQVLGQAVRQRLNDNGFRCGLVGTQLPESLRKLLDTKEESSTLEATSQREIDALSQNRRINTRSGKRNEIVTAAPQEEMIVLYRDSNADRVGGKTFTEAQTILATKSYPYGDGRVDLKLVPEIQFGQPKKQWIAGEGTFHLLSARDREVFSDLEIVASIMPGQTLILSCTPESKGLGQNFFVDTSHGDPQQKLLLIRLAQTQRDDLFELSEPLPDALISDEADGENALNQPLSR
ncbi:MAG: hypothetical protein P8N76_13375 [Pirellulaceae bacterium]|nr:hypothetical protein [Pirellulaceae bacterium]